MLAALAPSASLVDTASTMGLPFRRCDLQASVTGVSAIPAASFARVLPVAGATTRRSKSFFGPTGSTWAMLSRGGAPQMASIRLRKSLALPKRESVEPAAKDKIGITRT